MAAVVTFLIIVICILLMLVILVQNPKGGISSNFSGMNQIGGVKRTVDFLEKSTWTLGIALVILSIVSATLLSGTPTTAEQATESELKDVQTATPQLPATPPVDNNIPLPSQGQPVPGGDGGQQTPPEEPAK